LVVINPVPTEVKTLKINKLTPNSTISYQTDETGNLAKTNLAIINSIIEMNISPKSVTTIVIDN
jgi:hypothetical protein